MKKPDYTLLLCLAGCAVCVTEILYCLFEVVYYNIYHTYYIWTIINFNQ